MSDKGGLLAAGDAPILVHRRAGAGALLLWTTDVDDPEWTDLGAGPWVSLAHQAFLSGTWTSGIGLKTVASDSVLRIPAPEGAKVRVIDPDGNAFPGLSGPPGNRMAGPFEHLGVYGVETGSDTARIAVILAENRTAPAPRRWEEERARFLAAAEFQGRVVFRGAGEVSPGYGGTRLRLGMLLLAALLLFAEGAVSLRLAPISAPGGRGSEFTP